jgi:hypothetical protein
MAKEVLAWLFHAAVMMAPAMIRSRVMNWTTRKLQQASGVIEGYFRSIIIRRLEYN